MIFTHLRRAVAVLGAILPQGSRAVALDWRRYITAMRCCRRSPSVSVPRISLLPGIPLYGARGIERKKLLSPLLEAGV
jgi:hypothetical protein